MLRLLPTNFTVRPKWPFFNKETLVFQSVMPKKYRQVAKMG
jgi:hypothetical protein|tara:strand:+ start:121 stop:243 length:123 start_codon:yes stop_codon:yes gene_type:complete